MHQIFMFSALHVTHVRPHFQHQSIQPSLRNTGLIFVKSRQRVIQDTNSVSYRQPIRLLPTWTILIHDHVLYEILPAISFAPTLPSFHRYQVLLFNFVVFFFAKAPPHKLLDCQFSAATKLHRVPIHPIHLPYICDLHFNISVWFQIYCLLFSQSNSSASFDQLLITGVLSLVCVISSVIIYACHSITLFSSCLSLLTPGDWNVNQPTTIPNHLQHHQSRLY